MRVVDPPDDPIDLGGRDLVVFDVGGLDVRGLDLGSLDLGSLDLGSLDLGSHDLGGSDLGGCGFGRGLEGVNPSASLVPTATMACSCASFDIIASTPISISLLSRGLWETGATSHYRR